MEIKYPAALMLIFLVVIIATIIHKKNKNKTFDFSGSNVFIDMKKNISSPSNFSKALKSLVLSLLVLALSRPVTVEYIEADTQRSVLDIIFCVDVSTSMEKTISINKSTDYSNTGIQIAGNTLYSLSKTSSRERAGLVIFAESAYTIMPLSFDHYAIEYYSKTLSEYPGSISDGTSIWDALVVAMNRFDPEVKSSKAIVLITDGENNGGISVPKEVESALIKEEIRLYCLKIGDDSLVFESELKTICSSTLGGYFNVNNSSESEKVWDEIKTLEKNNIAKTDYFENHIDHYPLILIIAVILLVLSINIDYILYRGVIL